jgi:hypothetical protein
MRVNHLVQAVLQLLTKSICIGVEELTELMYYKPVCLIYS